MPEKRIPDPSKEDVVQIQFAKKAFTLFSSFWCKQRKSECTVLKRLHIVLFLIILSYLIQCWGFEKI